MQIGLRHFGAQTIARVVAASEEPGATRCGLARLLCELADWKDSKGRLALASARKVLPKVAAKAGFRLPEARPGVPDAAARVPAPDGLEADFGASVRDPGSRQPVAGEGVGGRRPALLGSDAGGLASSRLEASAGRAAALLDPFLGLRRAGRHRLCSRELAPECARRMDRLVGRRARGPSRACAVQSPLSAAAPHSRAGLAGAGDGDGSSCRGLERGLCDAARVGLYLCRPGTCRRELPGGRMVLLPAADLRASRRGARGQGSGARSG